MYQPTELKTTAYLPWSRARGVDVWEMFQAAAQGRVSTIERLAAADPALVDCEFNYYRPLYLAVRENQLAATRRLLELGADPMCGGLGFQPAYRPWKENNLPWPAHLARDRGFVEVAALLDSTLLARFNISLDGEAVPALIRAGDAAGALQAIQRRPELLHLADGFGSQPLHWAVMTRNLPLIDRLLELGADLERRRPDGAKPLDLSNGDYHYRGWRDLPAGAVQKHELVIAHLLARGAEYDICTAAELGDLARVQTLIRAAPELVNYIPPSTGYYKGAPLRVAAKGGHLAVVEFLLQAGADPNLPEAVAPMGGALYESIAGKHWAIMELLLKYGANAQAHLESSGTVFWRAKRDKAPEEIIKTLARHGGSLTPEMACYDNDLEALALMLNYAPTLKIYPHLSLDAPQQLELVQRYQPDVLTRVDWTQNLPVERARHLLQQGLSATRADWLGVTPLHRFAQSGHWELAELALEFGADVNAVDDDFRSTPLGWAARVGNQTMVERLLASGADPGVPAEFPWALPAAWAQRRGHLAVLQKLN